MSNRLTFIIAFLLLTFTFVFALLGVRNDSLTMDELAHLPAGYSYLSQQDMRLNPEHPPLIKDLAAVPLLFMDEINFPDQSEDWKEDVNGQWGFGNNLLYKSGNPAEKMIFWGRIPMILMLVLLGFYIFLWTRKLFSNKAAVLALFLFSFSPTFLAHGSLVTTDVGAAFGAFMATFYFVKYLKEKKKKNLIFAGIALGVAQLLKFSLILLFPFFGILLIIWSILKSSDLKGFLIKFLKYLLRFALITAITFAIIWIVYLFHTLNYPPEKQASDTAFILSSFSHRTLANTVVWMADKPVLRGIAHYFLGVFMILQRASGGNTGYFIGEVSAAGWKAYFPTVYLIKETLVFHILSVIALLYAVYLIKKPFWKDAKKRVGSWLREHFAEFALMFFVAIYWATSLKSNLNIGVRHLLPVFPGVMLLTAGLIGKGLSPRYKKIKIFGLAWLLLFQVYSVTSVFPHFLAYFNEAVGGAEMGHNYVVDSNLDWGQDLRRLDSWAESKNIDKIYLDYFGGADTKYHLGEKYVSWSGRNNPSEFPKNNYLAVSATLLQGGQGEPASSFTDPAGYYDWLDKYQLVERIGYSIFVFYIK